MIHDLNACKRNKGVKYLKMMPGSGLRLSAVETEFRRRVEAYSSDSDDVRRVAAQITLGLQLNPAITLRAVTLLDFRV